MGMLTEKPVAAEADGTEKIVILQGGVGSEAVKLMSPALLATAGTRPTPEELAAAILATLVGSATVALVDNGNGTYSPAIANNAALPGAPTVATAAANDNSLKVANTAFVKAAVDALSAAVGLLLDGKQGELVEGSNINLVDNGDGTFTISATGGGVTGTILAIPGNGAGLHGGQLVLGYDVSDAITGQANSTWNVDVQNAGNELRIFRIGADGSVVHSIRIDEPTGSVNFPSGATVPTEVYGPTWNGSTGLATKDAIYDKVETLVTSIAGKVASSAVGAANGVAPLDANGQVPAVNLPSYVDDVLEFANLAGFPNPGATGKVYVALDTNKQYRWSGSAYQELTASPGTTDNVPEGAANLYHTDARVRGAVATGLVDTAGTPAAADSMLTILGKVKKALFTDLPATIRSTVLTGLSTAAGGSIAATDTILAAFGKVQNSLDVLSTALTGKAPAFSTVNSYSVNTTVTDAAHNNNYNKLTGGTTRTLTFNATPTAGHTSVWVNRGTVNMTIACAAGYYKNGANATATANLTLAPGGKLTAFHEGAGVWTFDGTGF